MDVFRKELFLVILVFILAFGIRLGWGARVVSLTGDNFYAASDDGITYGPRAEDWVRGIDHSPLGTYSGFGYWVFLGLVYRIFGNPNYYAAIFIQAILGGMVAVLIYYIAKCISNPPVAATSAFLVALNMNNIFSSIVIGMEALFIPLMLLSLFLLIKYINNGKIRYLRYPFLIGVLLGVTTIVRTEPLFFFIVIVLCFLVFKKNRLSFRQSLKVVAFFCLGFFVILISFSARNYLKEEKFDFKSQSSSIGFTLVSSDGVKETRILSDMGFNPFADGNFGNSLDVFVKHPLRVCSFLAKGITKKGFNYLFVPNFGEMDFLTLLNSSGVGPSYRFPLYCKFYIYLFILIGLAILVLDKRFLLEKSILFGYMGYTVLIYAIIWANNARYRAVLEPLFIILFSSAVYFLITRFRKMTAFK
ncbi:glycosyltransferase family 39 protein [Candidatus Omnitrophota bacterium]